MMIHWCDRHGSNIGIGLDRCYYALERSFDHGPCNQSVRLLFTVEETDTLKRNLYDRAATRRAFDKAVEPVAMQYDGKDGWWIPADS